MSGFVYGPRSRLDAVVSGGLGHTTDPSSPLYRGPDAYARSIPAGWFRPLPNDTSVEDEIVRGGLVDRAYAWITLGLGDTDAPANPYEFPQLVTWRVRLDVGYVYGPALQAFVGVAAGTTETQAGAVLQPRTRADSDAELLKTALILTAMINNNGTNDIDPVILGIVRLGDATPKDVGAGKLIYSSTFSVNLAAYQPQYLPSAP